MTERRDTGVMDQSPDQEKPGSRRDDHWVAEAYLTHKDEVLTAVMCYLGGDRQVAEDVLHDVFVSLAKRRQPVIQKSVRNYLITACLHRSRDVIRRRTVRSSKGTLDLPAPAVSHDPSELLELEDESRRLLLALASLPEEQRAIVAMHIHGRMKFREIAEALDLSINTVQSRYRYALANLRRALADSAPSGG